MPLLTGDSPPRAMFFGMSATTTVEDLAHAVLEGVALGLLDALDVMMASGAPGPREIWLVGGGSRSPLWAQLISDVLGVTVKVPHDSSHAAAIGAARLAALAAGSAPARVLRDPQVQRVFTPAAERRSAALQRLARFRALYRATLPLLDAPHHAAPE
jgi:xylulokinase